MARLGPGGLCQKTLGQKVDQRPGVRKGARFCTGFAVNAEAELDLIVADPLLRLDPDQVAARQRQADRARTGGDLPCDLSDLVQRGAFGRACAGHLVDEQRACDAARLRIVRKGDVVADDDHLHPQAACPGHLGSQAEIEPVSGVVLDDEQAAGLSRDGQDRRQYGIDARRGEDLAAHGRRQHALADEGGMGRLVARPAPGNEGDALLSPVVPQHDLDVGKGVEAGSALSGGRGEKSFDGVGNDAVARPDEAFHISSRIQARRRNMEGARGKETSNTPGFASFISS